MAESRSSEESANSSAIRKKSATARPRRRAVSPLRASRRETRTGLRTTLSRPMRVGQDRCSAILGAAGDWPMRQLIISVHGIRTFGGWQERLAQLLKTQATDRQITVTNYKFGYFSVVAFIIPFLRWYVVRQFRKFLIDKAKEQAWDRIDLVGHSFGTHVIAWALYGIDEEK